MSNEFVSKEMYAELYSLPEFILADTFVILREHWICEPSNGEALISMMIVNEVMHKRGIKPERVKDSQAAYSAVDKMLKAMNASEAIIQA